jgi:hypothetical protein
MISEVHKEMTMDQDNMPHICRIRLEFTMYSNLFGDLVPAVGTGSLRNGYVDVAGFNREDCDKKVDIFIKKVNDILAEGHMK